MDNDGNLLPISMLKKAIIIVLLVLGFTVRLYKINNPVADWHSFRQVDTLSVTKNLLENKTDVLHPTYHDFSNLQSGKENPQGYRMVEFPIYNLASIGVYKLTHLFYPQISIEVASRLTSIIFSILSALFIFLICFKITREFTPSLFAMSVFLFLPFSIYYSRTTLPESMAVFFMLLTLYLFNKNIFLSGLSFCLGILIKPYIGFIIFPILLVLAFKKFNILKLLSFSLISLLPFILWRHWIQQYPEGIPYSAWLFNNNPKPIFPQWFKGYNLTFINHLTAFRPSWFRWLFYERIIFLISGIFGLIPLFLGFAYKKRLAQKATLSLFLGIIFYFIIVAQGNIRHDYYQILIIPSLSIILGFGYFYISQFIFTKKYISIITTMLIFGLSIFVSLIQIKEYYKINNPIIIEAGQKTNSILPQNSLIIAPYNGDTTFLYQTNHSGWPIEIYNIPEIKKQHPNNNLYLVSVSNDKYTNDIKQKYQTLFNNDKFIILDLNNEIKK